MKQIKVDVADNDCMLVPNAGNRIDRVVTGPGRISGIDLSQLKTNGSWQILRLASDDAILTATPDCQFIDVP